MRQFLGVAIIVGLFSMTSYGRLQPLVSGNYVTSLDWSSDSSLIAYSTGQILEPWTSNNDFSGIARVVDRNEEVVFSLNYQETIKTIEFNNFDNLILTFPYLQVWDIENGNAVINEPNDGLGMNAARWNPERNVILITGVRESLAYDPISRNTLSYFMTRSFAPSDFPENERLVNTIWSPSGNLGATTTTFGSIYVWDTTNLEGSLQVTFLGHTRSVSNLDWNSATNFIASGDASGRILVWNPTTGQIVRELVGHTDAILALDWSLDGTQLVSTSLDNTMRVWDWQSGNMQIIQSDKIISSVAYSPDGTEFAYAGEVTDPNNISIEIIPIEVLVPPSP